MNNNQISERALRNVFSTTSNINVGEKTAPLEYGLKPKPRSCFGGKQFLTRPLKNGCLGDAYFAGKHIWISDGDLFKDVLSYKDEQKEKKKGFLSGDFKRRDEYTKTVRVEQYREQLKQEKKMDKEALAIGVKALQKDEEFGDETRRPEENSVKSLSASGPYLYDLVFETEEGNSNRQKDIPRNTSKCARDTRNPTQLSNERSYGPLKTTSALYGFGIEGMEHAKPAYAKTSIVQSTFFRPTSIPFDSSN